MNVCCFAQLHTHMEHVLKHQNQQRAINLNNAESQTMHLETRLVLLDSSIQIELWQVKLTWPEEILLDQLGAVFGWFLRFDEKSASPLSLIMKHLQKTYSKYLQELDIKI